MTPISQEDDLLIAELAFGLLDAAEAAAAEARTAREPALAERLIDWQRLAAALLELGDQPAPPSLWTRIDRALPANDTAAAPADGRSALARWRAASLVLAVMATVLGVLAVRPPAPPPTPSAQPAARPDAPPLVALLRAPNRPAALSVGYDPGSGRLTLAADALDAGKGSAELWVIPADGKPRSLGLVDPAAPSWALAPTAARLIAPGTTLAITLEPRGGSPTGAPSGTPLLTGSVARAVAPRA